MDELPCHLWRIFYIKRIPTGFNQIPNYHNYYFWLKPFPIYHFNPRAKAHGNSMNGKLWNVYSKMGEAGSGYDYQNQNYEDIRLQVPLTL